MTEKSIARNVEGAVKKPSQKVEFTAVKQVSAMELLNASKGGGGKGGGYSVNVVFSSQNGVRVRLSQALHEALNAPTKIQVAQDGTSLILGEKLPGATETFNFSKGKGKNILYNSALVRWLIDAFSLDFSGGRVSRSYSNVQIETQEYKGAEIIYAIVHMVDVEGD